MASSESRGADPEPSRVYWVDAGVVAPDELHALYTGAAARAAPDSTLIVWARSARPHISVGASQNAVEDLDLEHCRSEGIPVIRRVLGGGAVWVDGDQDCFFIVRPRAALARGHRHLFALGLGIAVKALSACPDAHPPRIQGQDIWCGSRKVLGSGAATIDDGCVFGASLLLHFPAEAFLRCLRERSPGFRDWVRPALEAGVCGLDRVSAQADAVSQTAQPAPVSASSVTRPSGDAGRRSTELGSATGLRELVRKECRQRFGSRLHDQVLDTTRRQSWLESGREILAEYDDAASEGSAGTGIVPSGIRINREVFVFDTDTRVGRLRLHLCGGAIVRVWCADSALDRVVGPLLAGVAPVRLAVERVLEGQCSRLACCELARQIERLSGPVRALL